MDLQALVFAVNSYAAEDAFKPRMTLEQWRTMQGFMSFHELRAGELVVRQDDIDRSVFLLQDGSAQVYRSAVQNGDPSTRTRIAILRPGTIFGESGLFGPVPRLANVETMAASKVWVLVPTRWEELCTRYPMIGVEVLKAAGIVYATRMRANLTNRIAFT